MNAPLYSLTTPLSSVLTNKRRVGALKSLGIMTVEGALTYYPFRVTEPVKVQPLRQATIGESMAFAAKVAQVQIIPMQAHGGYRLEAIVNDGFFARSAGTTSSIAQLVFFSHRKSYIDWVSMRLKTGSVVVVAGQAGTFTDQLQFTHPQILTVPDPDEVPHAADGVQTGGSAQTGSAAPKSGQFEAIQYDSPSMQQALDAVRRPQPVYHANARISSEHIHETIVNLLEHLDEPIPDIIPEQIRQGRGLLHRKEAFEAIHNPQSTEDFGKGIATLRYEEALVSQTAVVRNRVKTQTAQARASAACDMTDRFIQSLPFALTNGQREVIDTIAADMSAEHPMQRLLQGEVGSGKTLVAICAMLQAVDSGFQAVLVVPTQVLAEQHRHTIETLLRQADLDIPVVMLTGGMKLAERRKALAQAASGVPGIIIATHSAFSRTFQAPNLALVVIDEQHRFGVEQRETLRLIEGPTPHLLVMTATPIPRTAAMTWFGDLDISWLTELPGGRKPIRTVVIPEVNVAEMARMFSHIRSRIDAGERAYVVCARIERDEDAPGEAGSAKVGESSGAATLTRTSNDVLDDVDLIDADDSDNQPALHSVAEIAQRLAHLQQFEGIAIATLTGRDDEATKQRVMAGFADGATPLLVSTTVIEVGVDVPQASCIVIFDADRFGLSQLHQLRGRVGRGGDDAWAFLVSRSTVADLASQRLDVIEHSLDGAEIAQADLELRGAGDVLGDAQAGGKSGLKLLRVVKDAPLIVDARKRAEQLLEEDPNLEQHVELAGAVLDFTRGHERFIASG